MANEERWTVIRAAIHFDELLEHVITTRKPVFIDGESKSAVLISMDEWISVQEKLRQRAPSAP
jgi:PHD/YefM family antitoxin component YafN of YafNO toxin-antitoxin module